MDKDTITMPRPDAVALSTPIEKQPLGYITGRIVAIVEHICDDVPQGFAALVGEDGYKLQYWLREALKREANSELTELADIYYANENSIAPNMRTAVIASPYTVGYCHQRSRLANQASRLAIGTRIKEARAEKGLTIRDLAEKSGIDKTQISRIEGGRANATIDTLNALAQTLGLRISID